MVKCIFTTKATAQQYRIEPNGSVFNSLAPANGYAQKICAEQFSALKSLPGLQTWVCSWNLEALFLSLKHECHGF